MLMNILKGVLRFFLWAIFSSLLGLALTSTIIYGLFSNRQNVISWLDKSNSYQGAADVLASGDLFEGEKDRQTLIFGKAAAKTFDAPFLKTTAEQAINSFYDWLEGKTTVPEFKLDIAAKKSGFAENAANLISEDLKKLPVCSGSTPSSDDLDKLLDSGCVPKDINIDLSVAELKSELASSQEIFGDTTIEATDLGKDDQGRSWFEQNNQIPEYYQDVKMVIVGLWAAVILDLVLLFLLSNRRKLLISLAVRTGITSAGLALSAVLTSGYINKQGSLATGNEQKVLFEKIFKPIITELSKSYSLLAYRLSGLLAVITLVLIVVLFFDEK